MARLGTGSGAEGQGLAEYSLILALIALAVIAALILLGTNLASTLSDIGETVGNVY